MKQYHRKNKLNNKSLKKYGLAFFFLDENGLKCDEFNQENFKGDTMLGASNLGCFEDFKVRNS